MIFLIEIFLKNRKRGKRLISTRKFLASQTIRNPSHLSDFILRIGPCRDANYYKLPKKEREDRRKNIYLDRQKNK